MAEYVRRLEATAPDVERARAAFAAQIPTLLVAREIVAHLFDVTFWGDLSRLADPDLPDPKYTEAARRLARLHFRPGTILYPARWRRLRPLFANWRDERGFWTAWQDLLAPLLVVAFADLRGESSAGLTLGSAFQALRRRLRREIEVELLRHTLDTQADGPLPPESAATVGRQRK